MNKRLIASVSCAALLLSSTSLAANTNSIKTAVDAVATATTAAPAPSTPATPTPSTPAPSAPKPTTTAPKATPVTENATEITRLLALNSVGSDVSLLQALLISNGYVLKVDGIYGVKTLAAVESYQGKNGLRVDGIVGPKTLAKLSPVVAEKPVEEVVDAVTTPSKVVKVEDIEKALSKDGAWMAYLTSDITTDKDLVLDANFTNKDKTARKLALYNYVTPGEKLPIDEYTLTAKSLTIKSANAKIQNGKFVGDIYVVSPNFQFVDVDVVGNVYFANEEIKTSTKIDEKTTITGKQEVLEVDTVSSASRVYVESDLERAFGKDGKWIVTMQDNLTTEKELVLDGSFLNKGNAARKVALYDQDSNKKSISEFTLTAKSLTIKSANAKLQRGKFVGDIYVAAPNFQLVDTDVEGNIYFANEEYKASFVMDEASTLTGKQEVMEVDSLSSASRVYTNNDLKRAFGKDGKWIVTFQNNITSDEELSLETTFANRNVPARKIALYDQDSTKQTIAEYTLTAPKLTVKSTNAKIQKGKFIGDIYVVAPGFQLVDADVEGNIFFARQEFFDSFKMDEASTLTGKKEVMEVDALSSASRVYTNADLERTFGKDGAWIVILHDNITTDKELVLDGEKTNRDVPARKIALYDQNSAKATTVELTLTAPKLTIKSPSARIQHGKFVGDIYVEAPNFQLVHADVEGNIYFLNEEAEKTFSMDENSTLTGVQKLVK
ncbi:peptidoglycan-binding domain-containing protein [Tissierella sp.]|uniref:peptidoglycan-binding domain-containing protein n=1 Tax=Tissierella sp. TaxID=41274 RepID=UPI00285A1B6C|nr:peptidoglycan-binding domain-containing protein [Tissierella sp.]MDR7855087.1 peptidoglycan-binding domain-containing protein [Tissierella sp.]